MSISKYVYNKVAALTDRGKVFDIIYFAYAKHLKFYSMTSLSLNWRDMNLVDGLLQWIRVWLDGHTQKLWSMTQCLNRDQ